MKLEHPSIGMAIRKCVFLNIANKDIIFCWVTSHVGIRGNEKADSAAKSAMDLPRSKVGVSYTDFKYLISQYIFSTWQNYWNGAVVNKLHSLKPVLGDWQSSYRRCRKDEVVLYRARIGHTYLTHSYILKKDSPQCEQCPCIRHILVECNQLARMVESFKRFGILFKTFNELICVTFIYCTALYTVFLIFFNFKFDNHFMHLPCSDTQ